MASSRGSSNSPDWMDVAANLTAFEVLNTVRLEIRLSTVDDHGLVDINVTVVAHERSQPLGEVSPLGSVSVTCSGTRLRSLEACLIHALYLLDSRLAQGEFASVIRQQ